MNYFEAREKILDIIGYLSNQMVRGWSAFLVAKNIHLAYQEGRISSSVFFFTATYQASIEAAFLTLSRILLKNRDSISFEYLLDVVSDNKSTYPPGYKENVLKTITNHKQELEQFASFRETLKTQRDKISAHLDREFVNNPGSISLIPPLDFNEGAKAFKFLLKVINAYKGYFDASVLLLSSLDSDIPEDIEYLLNLIKADNERDE